MDHLVYYSSSSVYIEICADSEVIDALRSEFVIHSVPPNKYYVYSDDVASIIAFLHCHEFVLNFKFCIS